MESTYNTFLTLIILSLHLLQIEAASFSRCSFDQYWNEILEICRSCLDVCEPLSRSSCRKLCEGYYITETLKKITESTTTTPTTTMTNAAFLKQIGNPDKLPVPFTSLYVVIPLASIVVVAAIFAIAIRIGSPYRIRGNHMNTDRSTNAANNPEEAKLNPLKEDSFIAQAHNSEVREKEDDEKSIWSGRAVYDDNNRCIQIQGMDRLMNKEMGKSHSI